MHDLFSEIVPIGEIFPNCMCAVPALTPAARTARAAPAFFGLQTLFDLLRPRDIPALDLLVDVGSCLPLEAARSLIAESGLSACWRMWTWDNAHVLLARTCKLLSPFLPSPPCLEISPSPRRSAFSLFYHPK